MGYLSWAVTQSDSSGRQVSLGDLRKWDQRPKDVGRVVQIWMMVA